MPGRNELGFPQQNLHDTIASGSQLQVIADHESSDLKGSLH